MTTILFDASALVLLGSALAFIRHAPIKLRVFAWSLAVFYAIWLGVM